MAVARPFLFRDDDRLVLRSGPRGSAFVAVGVSGLGPLNARRPLIVWDDVHAFEVVAGVPRGRVRRGIGVAVALVATRPDDEGRLEDPAFPDRVVARWVLTRRDESKAAGLGYVPRGIGIDEVDQALRTIRAIAAAPDAEARAELISRVPTP
jgi:hypothetical protein